MGKIFAMGFGGAFCAGGVCGAFCDGGVGWSGGGEPNIGSRTGMVDAVEGIGGVPLAFCPMVNVCKILLCFIRYII